MSLSCHTISEGGPSLPHPIAFPLTRRRLFLYHDIGVSEESFAQTWQACSLLQLFGYKLEAITAPQVASGLWRASAALFVLPGGADLPYLQSLQGDGNIHIRQYVHQGGAFLGLCAGAYYASSDVVFDRAGPLEVLGPRPLQFAPYPCEGPTLAPYHYDSHQGARSALITTSLPHLHQGRVFYNGGGGFPLAHNGPQTQILARYENHVPAILQCSVGQGVAILSGVHFEYNPSTLVPQSPLLQTLCNDLLPWEDFRQSLLHNVFHRLHLVDVKALAISKNPCFSI